MQNQQYSCMTDQRQDIDVDYRDRERNRDRYVGWGEIFYCKIY